MPEGAYVKPGKVKITFRNRIGKESVYGVIYDPRHGIPNLNDESAQLTAHFSQPMEFLTGKQVATSRCSANCSARRVSRPISASPSRRDLSVHRPQRLDPPCISGWVISALIEIVRKHFTLRVTSSRNAAARSSRRWVTRSLATFSEPLTALQTALRDQPADQEDRRRSRCLIIKIGIHMGPCIAVENRERPRLFRANGEFSGARCRRPLPKRVARHHRPGLPTGAQESDRGSEAHLEDRFGAAPRHRRGEAGVSAGAKMFSDPTSPLPRCQGGANVDRQIFPLPACVGPGLGSGVYTDVLPNLPI
ncbi:MAG: hypothetical protein IPK17_30460 [Chloroflexi bacterium]|uniref:hypothetical protein n=1 Tax=Candidatus Flexifilum breve TaxID=3140694 RepID=UPI003134FFEA|nr:hypothetical protein [Chloroflexota bacterium]